MEVAVAPIEVSTNNNNQTLPKTSIKTNEIISTQKARLADQDTQKALYGALAYLEDNQIRPRKEKLSSLFTYSESKKGAKSHAIFNVGLFKSSHQLKLPSPLKVRNLVGEWPSQIHVFPNTLGKYSRTFASVQDSNMFVTAFCAFPLHFISEDLPENESKIIENMLQLAHENIEEFRRGNSFNFWTEQPKQYGETSRTGPLNLWVEMIDKLARFYVNPKNRKMFDKLSENLRVPTAKWLIRCMDKSQNPNGADTLFNVANDSDDSSVAIAIDYLQDGKLSSANEKILKELAQFRDIDRSDIPHEDLDTWKGGETGAFLTWLKDEDIPTFEQAEIGVIPGGFNNVDIVVNANVIFALALADKQNTPGFNESCELLARAIREKRWPEAGIYYPQLMIFPYAITRAIRDGGAHHPALMAARPKLMQDVLDLATPSKQNNVLIYFPGGNDQSVDFSTALALNTLMNLGEEVAREIGCLSKYQQVLEGGIRFLMSKAKYSTCNFKETRKKFSASRLDKIVATWEDGLFFSSAYWDLAIWRSQSVTNAAVLETISKYLEAADKKPYEKVTANSKHGLVVRSYSINQFSTGDWLAIV